MEIGELNEDYFYKICNQSCDALERLIYDIHTCKSETVERILNFHESEKLLYTFFTLLSHENERFSGNAAYIIGTLCENKNGTEKIINLLSKEKNNESLLYKIAQLLHSNDMEIIMNSCGAIATIAESEVGRNYILSNAYTDECIDMLVNIVDRTDNNWAVSNAFLVIARISITYNGCNYILNHKSIESIIMSIYNYLKCDKFGMGMNCAFIIGRFADVSNGIEKIMGCINLNKVIEKLFNMLLETFGGCSKNACFAISVIAGCYLGNNILLKYPKVGELFTTTLDLLYSSDCELGWFCAMMINVIVAFPRAAKIFRENSENINIIKSIMRTSSLDEEIILELKHVVHKISDLITPHPPTYKITEDKKYIQLEWGNYDKYSYFTLTYQLIQGDVIIYSGRCFSHFVGILDDHDSNVFKLVISNKVMKTESEHLIVTFLNTSNSLIEETKDIINVDTTPYNVRLKGISCHQAKIEWSCQAYDLTNNIMKFIVYLDKKVHVGTRNSYVLLKNLRSNTEYNIEIALYHNNNYTKRSNVFIFKTKSYGESEPDKPIVAVLGRSHIYVTWKPPEYLNGKLFRYELYMNNVLIYCGCELFYDIHNLTPNTEYNFKISVLTSRGRFNGKPSMKRTLKNEYENTKRSISFFRRNTIAEIPNQKRNKCSLDPKFILPLDHDLKTKCKSDESSLKITKSLKYGNVKSKTFVQDNKHLNDKLNKDNIKIQPKLFIPNFNQKNDFKYRNKIKNRIIINNLLSNTYKNCKLSLYNNCIKPLLSKNEEKRINTILNKGRLKDSKKNKIYNYDEINEYKNKIIHDYKNNGILKAPIKRSNTFWIRKESTSSKTSNISNCKLSLNSTSNSMPTIRKDDYGLILLNGKLTFKSKTKKEQTIAYNNYICLNKLKNLNYIYKNNKTNKYIPFKKYKFKKCELPEFQDMKVSKCRQKSYVQQFHNRFIDNSRMEDLETKDFSRVDVLSLNLPKLNKNKSKSKDIQKKYATNVYISIPNSVQNKKCMHCYLK